MTTTRLYTVEDIAALPDDAHRYDLIRGELVCMPPAGYEHGSVAMSIGARIWNFVREHGLGTVFAAETGFILRRDPDSLLAPDVAFVRAGRLDHERDRQGFARIAPDLAVEVISPSERAGKIRDKVEEYLATGVRLLWLLNSRRRTVTVHAPGRAPRILTEQDELDGEDVLPGFRLRVADIFR